MELYIHFPFCVQKCRYCDFVSFSGCEGRMEEYVYAVLREAELRRLEAEEPIETVYFGGGTPSLLPISLMKNFLTGLKKILPLENVREWTTEANPGCLSSEWLDVCREGGINRLSLGMQAAQPRLLSLLGRIHLLKDVALGVDLARKAGFENLNLDLIFGIPTQRPEEWTETLEAAISLTPEHVSAYGLIPEEGTPVWQDLRQKTYCLPEPEEERMMYEETINFLGQHHYQQYEISNFALPGHVCLHNIGYWNQTPYMGLGLSAASMIFLKSGEEGLKYLRKTNTADLEIYLQSIRNGSPKLSESQWISGCESRFETMMLGLRMNEGVQEDRFLTLHGVSMEDCYGKKLRSLQTSGLVIWEKGVCRLTRAGFDLQNSVLVDLIED